MPALVAGILLPTIVIITFRIAKAVDGGGYEHRFRAASPEAVWDELG